MSKGALLNQNKEIVAEDVGAGTFPGKIVANANSVSNLGAKQVRNIYAGTTDIGVGASLPTGDIYLVYE